MITKQKPFYDERFSQWCISYKLKDGGYGAVWGDTEEECINLYEKIKGEII